LPIRGLGYPRAVILPPLPPVAPHWRPAGPDLLDLLAAQHRALAARPRTADLVRHLSAEEQYLLPTVRGVLPDGGALAEAELAAGAAIRAALRDGADVAGLVRAHARRCEVRLFPALRAALDDTTRIRLGNRAVIAHEAAPTRPHLGTPCRPPWNRLVEPVVGVLDRIRDTFSAPLGRAPS
jgi:hypothetical protein